MANFNPHPIGRSPYLADAESATEKEYASENESDALGDVGKFFGDVWNGARTFARAAATVTPALHYTPVKLLLLDSDEESATETEAVGHHGGPHSAGGGPIGEGELIYLDAPFSILKDPDGNGGSRAPSGRIGGQAGPAPVAGDGAPVGFGPVGPGVIYTDLPVSTLKDPDIFKAADCYRGGEAPIAVGFSGPGVLSSSSGEDYSFKVKDPSEVPGNSGGGEAPTGRMGGQAGPAPIAGGGSAIEVVDLGLGNLSMVVPDESTGNFTSSVRRFFGQSDLVTGDGLANADADSSGWFQMHHDDVIQDGYLDVDSSAFDSITGAQPDDVIHTSNGSIITGLNPDDVVQVNASGFDAFLLQSGSDLIAPIAEPFAGAAAITGLMTGKSSPMETAIDPLVAAGPLDVVKVVEPRNNDF